MDKLKLLGILAIILVPLLIIVFIVAVINASGSSACFYRYPTDSYSTGAVTTLETLTLRASGNYGTTLDPQGAVTADPNALYGQWVTMNTSVAQDEVVYVNVTGTVSLCRAPLLQYNVASDSNRDAGGSIIYLPRVEEKVIDKNGFNANDYIFNTGLPLIFNSQNNKWGNVAKIEVNDTLQVILSPNTTSTTASAYNVFGSSGLVNLQARTYNCSYGNTVYDPVCGVYTFYKGNYVSACQLVSTSAPLRIEANCTGSCKDFLGIRHYNDYNSIVCSKPNCRNYCTTKCQDWGSMTETAWVVSGTTNIPLPYASDGSTTFSMITSPSNLNSLVFNFSSGNCDGGNYPYTSTTKFWLKDGNGLVWKLDQGSLDPSNKYQIGSGYNVVSPVTKDGQKIIYSVTAENISQTGYLRYMLFDNNNAANSIDSTNNTGGYVLNVKHTKCVRKNGKGLTDSIGNQMTGQVQYTLLDNFGDTPSGSGYDLEVDGNGKGSIKALKDGFLAFRIANNSSFHSQSIGQYQIEVNKKAPIQSFGSKLSQVIVTLKTQMLNAGKNIFSNMVCYKGNSTVTQAGSKYTITYDKSRDIAPCINFFTYIKAMLSLYIMIYALRYLVGLEQVSQEELVTRIVKVAIVAGLISEQTFVFFSNYVYPIITGATDSIIGNISGYAPFNVAASSTQTVKITNPMMFLDNVMSNIFFSKTFVSQMTATLSSGLTGIFYFFMLFVTIIVFIMAVLNAIAIYIISFVGLAIMVAIAPIVLTFILFETTKSFFIKWIDLVFRYLIEPVILMVGVIILVQLFSIYLDYTLGFSVCWKCAIPISLPFKNVPVLGPLFKLPVFCIYWFAPWGLDPTSYAISFGLSKFIILFMIAYILNGYVSISSQVTSTISGASSAAADKFVSKFGDVASAVNTTTKAVKEAGSFLSKVHNAMPHKRKDKELDGFAQKIDDKDKDKEKEEKEKEGKEKQEAQKNLGISKGGEGGNSSGGEGGKGSGGEGGKGSGGEGGKGSGDPSQGSSKKPVSADSKESAKSGGSSNNDTGAPKSSSPQSNNTQQASQGQQGAGKPSEDVAMQKLDEAARTGNPFEITDGLAKADQAQTREEANRALDETAKQGNPFAVVEAFDAQQEAKKENNTSSESGVDSSGATNSGGEGGGK